MEGLTFTPLLLAISAYEDKVASLSTAKADLESQRDSLQAELLKEKKTFAEMWERLGNDHSGLVQEHESLTETIASIQKEMQGTAKN